MKFSELLRQGEQYAHKKGITLKRGAWADSRNNTCCPIVAACLSITGEKLQTIQDDRWLDIGRTADIIRPHVNIDSFPTGNSILMGVMKPLEYYIGWTTRQFDDGESLGEIIAFLEHYGQ